MGVAVDDVPFRMGFDDYVRFEETAEVRSEFIDGVVYAMAGETIAHNELVMALYRQLYPAARADGCRVAVENVLLAIDGRHGLYPDLMVTCDEPTDPRLERTPCLVVEVSSPTTERFDRTTKHAAYTSIPGLKAYLLVSSLGGVVVAELHRNRGSLWQRETYTADEPIVLECPSITFRLSDVPANV
jgi:Uma2 family endonuclease